MEKIFTATNTDRDFPEDAHLENGNYFKFCCICGKPFTGHKRRVICKQCSKNSKGIQDKQ